LGRRPPGFVKQCDARRKGEIPGKEVRGQSRAGGFARRAKKQKGQKKTKSRPPRARNKKGKQTKDARGEKKKKKKTHPSTNAVLKEWQQLSGMTEKQKWGRRSSVNAGYTTGLAVGVS